MSDRCGDCGANIYVGDPAIVRIHYVAEHGWPTATLLPEDIRGLLLVAEGWGIECPSEASY